MRRGAYGREARGEAVRDDRGGPSMPARSRDGAQVTAGVPRFDLLERLLDGALDLDPETRRALAGLSGKVVDLDVAGVGALRLRILDERVRVEPRSDAGEADVTIRGAPFSLLRFALADDRERLLLGDEVGLHGDIALATRLQQIAARLDVDVEEALACRIGDIPAHEVMRGVRGVGTWMRAAGAALLADVSEYVRYEAALTPHREDVGRFSHAVDDLRDDVERLEARIERLERRQAPPP